MKLNKTIRNTFFCVFVNLILSTFLYAEEALSDNKSKQDIISLIDQYVQAREGRDQGLLGKILTPDVDQLVSSGKWRIGISESTAGMLRSSKKNPGTRTLRVEKVRFLNSASAIVDARYEIQNPDASIRKMWSTFIVVYVEGRWKITAIRNMLPRKPS